MRETVRRSAKVSIRPRLRITCGAEIALGPGKVELLELIDRTGSIAEAAKRMEMSYMRAWMLVQTMTACFREPLVTTVRGGRARGGARLTATGATAVALYREMEGACQRAVSRQGEKLRSLLRG